MVLTQVDCGRNVLLSISCTGTTQDAKGSCSRTQLTVRAGIEGAATINSPLILVILISAVPGIKLTLIGRSALR